MLKICVTEAHYKLDMKFYVATSQVHHLTIRGGYSYEAVCAKLSIDGCELHDCV